MRFHQQYVSLLDLDISSIQGTEAENVDPKTINDSTPDKNSDETFDTLLTKLQTGIDIQSQSVKTADAKAKAISDGIPSSFKTIEDPTNAVEYAKANLGDAEFILTFIAEALFRVNKTVADIPRIKENLEFTEKVPKEYPEKYGALIHSIDQLSEDVHKLKTLLADTMTQLIGNKEILIAMIKKHLPSWEDKQTSPVKDAKSAFAAEDEKKDSIQGPAVSPIREE
ncbi:uncharacterized protein N7483_003970 [Penicillium malachiteum]|uniref:uncharacterized protein n=1 Tax=Penicillium malachiteum TaxID=1324776 RepID=UPI0025477522|nr:uncharacterized protein N7483_003970 [Penicillium malachiteum]KAJ5729462.1 hypothetical protein N7483_003970 [Penicillium malachiteum]